MVESKQKIQIIVWVITLPVDASSTNFDNVEINWVHLMDVTSMVRVVVNLVVYLYDVYFMDNLISDAHLNDGMAVSVIDCSYRHVYVRVYMD